MVNIEFGEPSNNGEAETIEARRQQLARSYYDLRMAVAELIESGAAQDGHAKTPELLQAEALGERLKGEPLRGVLHGNHYYLEQKPPPRYLSNPVYLPRGFDTPRVLGTLEGVIKMDKVQDNGELVIGVGALAITDNDALKARYQYDGFAQTRWHQPLGLRRNKDRDKILWLPAVDFRFDPDYKADDYLSAEVRSAEEFRAFFKHRFPPESPTIE